MNGKREEGEEVLTEWSDDKDVISSCIISAKQVSWAISRDATIVLL